MVKGQDVALTDDPGPKYWEVSYDKYLVGRDSSMIYANPYSFM